MLRVWFTVPPKIQLPKTFKVLPGVGISCKAHGTPPIKVTWLKDSTSLVSSTDGLVTYSVEHVEEGGVFTCFATNDAGNNSADVMVVVSSK